MSEARNAILGAVRRSLIEGEQRSTIVHAAVKARIESRSISIRPNITGDLVERYCEKHQEVHGTLDRLVSVSEITGALDDYLQRNKLGLELVLGAGPILNDVDWPKEWSIDRRPAKITDRIVVSEAFAGIAETGTLVFERTAQSPTSHIFLAEYHLVILDARQIIKYQEELWARFRFEKDIFPSVVNLVTGPSKTADVEQTIEYGAHGPRCVHVLLVGR